MNHPLRWKAMATVVVFLILTVTVVDAGPNRYGHSERVERHMLPFVSTGPMDPAWSPDGRWIAFSMRGDIWKIPAAGGEAIALTAGPAYHYEPSWSPDGSRVALSMDLDGNLDIGVVSAEGGAVQRITTGPRVDVEPAWSHDGRSLYFVSARDGDFKIYQQNLGDSTARLVTTGFQPAVSPDGAQMLYVAPVPGKLGTGGVWVRSLRDSSAPKLVQYEETEYRTKPAWMPDGHSFLYVSDEMGSNDVRVLPVSGGNPIVLTIDQRDEYGPTPSPDGTRFAFVSNRAGPMTLFTTDLGAGPPTNWRAVPITSRHSRVPTGRVRLRVLGTDGKPIPARIYLQASDGRSYAPDGGFHRVMAQTETHYFHTTGEAEVEVPAGQTTIEAMHGYEWRPATATAQVPAGGVQTVTLRPERLIDMAQRGWYSGETHGHDLHQGLQGLSHEEFFNQLLAEDVNVFNAMIHMDGTRLMGRWEDLTGKPHPLSTPTHILQYGEEYRGSLGHLGLIGIKTYLLPFNNGVGGTTFNAPVLDASYIDSTHAQGGIVGFPHPFSAHITRPSGLSGTLIPVNAAMGKGDYFDIAAMSSDEMASVEVYYKLLNCGFRIAAGGGTDNFADVGRDPPPAVDRTYVKVNGPFSLETWMAGIKAMHTFVTTGPLLFLDVAGKQPGDELAISGEGATSVHVRAEVISIPAVDTLEIIVNGQVAAVTPATDKGHVLFDGQVPVPVGGWVAARARGPASRYVGDSYAFAQTSPVWVVKNGRRYTSPEDARFLGEGVDALWARVMDAKWHTAADSARFHAGILAARAVYRRIEEQAMAKASR